MVQVSTEALPGTLDEMQRDSLKGFLREACPRLFSLPERELTKNDFGFIFPVLGEGSEPSHDVVVRIRLNPDPDRLLFATAHALELQAGVSDTVILATSPHPDLSVGICLDYGVEIVWCDDYGVV
jgi:hypothetical protein